MGRKIICAGLSALLALSLCGCGGGSGAQSSAKQIDLEQLGTDLAALCDEELYRLDEETAAVVYEGMAAEEILAWASSGATANEVVLFRAKDEAAADAIEEAVEIRLEDREESYADYLPEEAAKLDEAVVEQEGVYVAVCVSPDSQQAESIIDKALRGQ